MTLFSALRCTTPSALTPKPQSKVMIDESMCPWLGRADRDTRGMPHKTNIVRKPRGVGAEFKDTADVETGVISWWAGGGV